MQFDPLKRRDFITLLGSTAITLPLPVRAQPAERMRRLGVLVNLAADDPESQARIGAFLQTLREFGWTMGRNIQIDYRYAGGNADRIRSEPRRFHTTKTRSGPCCGCQIALQQTTERLLDYLVGAADER
jgi:hypothetical protein